MKQFENPKILRKESMPVSDLLNSPAKLEALTGDAGMDNEITGKNLYRPQLALSGFVELFNYKQVQVFGNTELFYLKSLDNNKRKKSVKTLLEFDIPCIVLTNNHTLEPDLLELAKNKRIPILKTAYPTTKASFLLSEFLDDQFSEQIVVHGSFVDVYGVGILFTGRSAIGKSEIALDLVERGHRLVADDVVMITQKRGTTLMGTGTSMIQHFMEIRGLGMIDVRQMFGIRSIRFQKRVEIIVELEDWSSSGDYTRTGLDEEPANVMGVEVTTVKLPIFPGKNITVIAEVIAINYLLRTYGYDTAQVFADKLKDNLTNKSSMKPGVADQRMINYFQGDIE